MLKITKTKRPGEEKLLLPTSLEALLPIPPVFKGLMSKSGASWENNWAGKNQQFKGTF